MVDISALLKLDLSKIKKSAKNQFFGAVLSNLIPNNLYVRLIAVVNNGETESKYSTSSTKLEIVNLKDKDTQNLFKVLNLVSNIGDYTKVGKNLSSNLVDAIISNQGFFGKCKLEGALDFNFETVDDVNSFVVYKIDTNEEKTLTYLNTKEAENTNVTKYKITDKKIELKNLSLNGYTFEGWYMLVDGVETKIETINAKTFVDYSLTAKWTTNTYTISISLNGGKIGETENLYTIDYNIETENFVLPKPTKVVGEVNCPFKGYLGSTLESLTIDVTITKGTFGNLQFSAFYEGETKSVSLNVEGTNVLTFDVDTGSKLNENTILNSSQIGMSGYNVPKWYTDAEKTLEYDFNLEIVDDLTLYGDWDYIVDNVYFYPYLSTFNAGIAANYIEIKSHRMMIAYIDYAIFYNIKDKINLKLTYVENNTTQIGNEIQLALTDYETSTHYKTNYTCSYGASGTMLNMNGQFYITSNIIEPTNVIDSTQQHVYTQQDYALKNLTSQTRTNEFNNFNIEKVNKQITVSTSQQLVWVLENGYKPNCLSGSSAEAVYNSAKQVLISIINDDMEDIEKISAIYQWLILNVKYDQKALELSSSMTSAEAYSYDSWSPEGVFNNQKAVCEGYAKAFIILAEIENIPAIYVTGNDHAWNRVYLNNNWYGIDATHGDVGNPSKQIEILTYDSFLFTDEYKTSKGFETDEYSTLQATTQYQYYENAVYNQDSQNFDLLINSSNELTLLFKYVKAYHNSIGSEYTTFEFAISKTDKIYFDAWMLYAKTHSGLNYNSYYETTNDLEQTIYSILIAA